MAEAISVDAKKFNADMAKFQGRMDRLREFAGPRATTIAGNRVVRAAVTIATRATIADLHSNGVTEVKQKHIRNRMRVRNMSVKKPKAYLNAYVQDMPAIHLGLNRQGIAKGKKFYRESISFNARKPGKNSKVGGSYSKIGGVKVGGKFFPNAFINVIRKNQTVHILRRKQKATWAGRVRLPIDVIKYPLRQAFAKHFAPSLQKSIDANYQKEFDRAMTLELAKLLNRK